MSWSYVSVDQDTLPAALTPVLKDHLRITFDEDDDLITRYLQWAIDYRQRLTGQQWFAATVSWIPDTTASRAQCPVQPVSAFTVMSDVDDVSADYELQAASPVEPVWLVRSDGTAFHSDAVVTLTVGAEELPPAEEGNVLRLAATLYEHRESVTAAGLEQMPRWLDDSLGGLWIPRA